MYHKKNGIWKQILKYYKKVNGSWTQIQESSFLTEINSNLICYGGSISTIANPLVINAPSSYTGKSFFCTCQYSGVTVYPTWAITSGSQYASINSNGKVTINEGVTDQSITVTATYSGQTETKTISISYDNQLTIEGADTMTGTSGNVIAKYNSTVVTPTWSITSGGSHATINSSGAITIISSGEITISATYNNYTATKTITLVYNANQSSQTEVDPDTGAVTTTETTTTTDPDTGATTETSTSTTTNEDGSTSTTETETVVNPDGSGTTSSTTQNSDGTSSETNGTMNADGSSQSQTTNYDENGDPTSGSNNTVDTSGNSNTQDVVYDENGNSSVSGYTVDTSGNPNGTGEGTPTGGLDTGLIVFDGQGFECTLVFKCSMSNNIGNNIFGAIQRSLQNQSRYAGFNLAIPSSAKVNMYAGTNSAMYSSGAIGSNIHTGQKYWSISSSNNTSANTQYTFKLVYLPADYTATTTDYGTITNTSSSYGKVIAELTPVKTSGSTYYQTNPFERATNSIPTSLPEATFTLGGNGINNSYDMDSTFKVISFYVHKI